MPASRCAAVFEFVESGVAVCEGAGPVMACLNLTGVTEIDIDVTVDITPISADGETLHAHNPHVYCFTVYSYVHYIGSS